MAQDIRELLAIDPAIQSAGMVIGGTRITLADPDDEGDCRLEFAMSFQASSGEPDGTFTLQTFGRDGLIEEVFYPHVHRTLRENEFQLERSGYVKDCDRVELLYTPPEVW